MSKRRKIIIEVRDDQVDDWTAVTLVKRVVEHGKVSREKGKDVYCHATGFEVEGREVNVVRAPYTRPGLIKFVIYGPYSEGDER